MRSGVHVLEMEDFLASSPCLIAAGLHALSSKPLGRPSQEGAQVPDLVSPTFF